MLEADNLEHKTCFTHFFSITLVPFLLLAALFLAYFGLLPLKVEMHTLIIVTFIFIIFLFYVRHSANYAACRMKNTFSSMEKELEGELRTNALTIMDKTKSTLKVKDFIREYYKSARNDNYARVAPSIFPMLGILGTFIAIAISMPDFTVKDVEALDREISLLLSGIGTAFYASIYGISLSLLWTFFEKLGESKIEKNIHDLENIYNGSIWSMAELTKHNHVQNEFRNQEIVQTLSETFNMHFIKELNDQYLKSFTTIMSETTMSFSKLTEHMQEATVQLNRTVNKVQNRQESINAVSTISKNIEAFNDNAQNLTQSLDRFDATVEHTFDNIDHEIGKVVEKLSTFAHIISEQNQEILDKHK